MIIFTETLSVLIQSHIFFVRGFQTYYYEYVIYVKDCNNHVYVDFFFYRLLIYINNNNVQVLQKSTATVTIQLLLQEALPTRLSMCYLLIALHNVWVLLNCIVLLVACLPPALDTMVRGCQINLLGTMVDSLDHKVLGFHSHSRLAYLVEE